MEEDKDIEVDCKKITPKGKLICDIGMKDAAEMLRRGIKPEHTEFNVKDKVLDSSQSTVENKSTEGTQATVENKSTEGTQATVENKSTEGTQATVENKSTEGIKPTEADSSNNQGCGCSKTIESSKIANFVAKYGLNEEN